MQVVFVLLAIVLFVVLAHCVAESMRRRSVIPPEARFGSFATPQPVLFSSVGGLRWPLRGWGTGNATLPLVRVVLRPGHLQLGPSTPPLKTLIPRWDIEIRRIQYVREVRALFHGGLRGIEVRIDGSSMLVLTPDWPRLLEQLAVLGVPALPSGAKQRWSSTEPTPKPPLL